MNESPWISIIIPVYNAGQYFEECLQTVCGNTQLDIEIIQEIPIARRYRLVIDMFPNLLAHSCVFELRRRQK